MAPVWARYTLSPFWSCRTWASENQSAQGHPAHEPGEQASHPTVCLECSGKCHIQAVDVQAFLKHLINFWLLGQGWMCGYCEEEIEAGWEVFSPSPPLLLRPWQWLLYCMITGVRSSFPLMNVTAYCKLVVMIDWSLGIRSYLTYDWSISISMLIQLKLTAGFILLNNFSASHLTTK